MKKIGKNFLKLISNKYFIFSIAFLLSIIWIYNVDILFGSMDAYETIEVSKTFFSVNKYASYVMYKGLYAFIPSVISIIFGNLTKIHSLFLLKIMKSLIFAYVTTMGIPYMIGKIFKQKVSFWQIYLFIILIFLLERKNFFLVSVDLSSFVAFLLCINYLIKVTLKYSHLRLFILGLLLGISTCFSGQYSIATYILLIYLLITLIIKNHQKIKMLLLVIIILLGGFTITKSADILYEKLIINELREKGAWIPTGSDWFKHGLSVKMTYINFPANLTDNLGLAIAKNDNEDIYNNLLNQIDSYEVDYYFKMVTKYPVAFIVRWTERLFLGLVNDPMNAYPTPLKQTSLIISLMSISLYVLWMYIRLYLKTFKQLFSLNSIIFYSFLFTALVPSFGHVENRYYMACRIILIGILVLSPLLRDFSKKIKDKEIKFNNINLNVITGFIFVVICLVVYYAIYSITAISLVS